MDFDPPQASEETMDEDEELMVDDEDELENADVSGGSSSSSLAAGSPHGNSSDSSQSPSLKVGSPTRTAATTAQPEKRHVCDMCGKGFSYLSILESHKRSHTGEKPFSCHFCEKRFAQKATLQVHERTHTGERPYKCRYCEKTFAQYGTKTVHEKSAHLGIRNYKCPKCDKCLSSPSALYTHKKTHGDKTFCCQFCTKTFALKNYLKLHVKQVHEQNERKHVCVHCNKGFAYAGSLQVHIRTHTGERPYTCRFCPKAFASQGNLQSHERTHTGERPFVCQFCHRTFIQKSQLTAHEATHTSGHQEPQQMDVGVNVGVGGGNGAVGGPEPMGNFECKLCPRRFPFASALIAHMRKHSSEKAFNYTCGGCGKSYSQKIGLNIHAEQCDAFRKLLAKGDDAKMEPDRPFALQNIYQVPPVDLQQLCNLKMRMGGNPLVSVPGQSAFTPTTPVFAQQPMMAAAPMPSFVPMELNEYGPLVGSQPPSSLSDMKVSDNLSAFHAPVAKAPVDALKDLLDVRQQPSLFPAQMLLQQLQAGGVGAGGGGGDVLSSLISQNLLSLAAAASAATPMQPQMLTALLPLLQANMGLSGGSFDV